MTRETFLPFSQPTIEDDEIEEVVDTLRSGWLTTGPKVQRLEDDFRRYVGARHAVAVSSCTAGLHLALASASIGPGDEVILPSFTFVSCANSIVHLGATPVFCEVGPDFNMDPADVERRLTPRTRALMPVDYSGQPCDMDAITAIADEHGLFVVEDAAHALGARYRGRRIGSISPATAFSFYPTKTITTGEGGMVTTDDDRLAERMRLMALHGMSHDAWKRYGAEGSWFYEVLFAGYKYNMTDIAAALGLHQLAKVDRFVAARETLVGQYEVGLANVSEIKRPVVNAGVKHAWHLYAIQLDLERLEINRAQFIERLRERNIGASVHFIPIHLFPYYQNRFGHQRGDFPVTEALYDGIVSLPLFPRMGPDDVADVVAAVRGIVATSRK